MNSIDIDMIGNNLIDLDIIGNNILSTLLS